MFLFRVVFVFLIFAGIIELVFFEFWLLGIATILFPIVTFVVIKPLREDIREFGQEILDFLKPKFKYTDSRLNRILLELLIITVIIGLLYLALLR